MKAFNTAAAVALGIATLCSALPAQAAASPQGLREQRFLQSIGVAPGTTVIYANSKGQNIAFPQFKQEIDRNGSLKIANQGLHGETMVMKVATRAFTPLS